MTKEVITITPSNTLLEVKHIFDRNTIHHIPVIKDHELVGIVSKSDFLFFLRGFEKSLYEKIKDMERLKTYTVQEVMVTGLAKLEASDPIRNAIEVFKLNLLHAIPIVEGNTLVGILTTHDIIKALSVEPIALEDYS